MTRLRVVAAVLAGMILGGAITLSVQAGGALSEGLPSAPHARSASFPASELPTTFLAWVQGGLPPGFVARTRRLPGVGHVATVAEDHAWLERSWSAAGDVVDRPSRPFAIPIDAAAVEPRSFARFLPTTERALSAALANGEGILGASSARLRGLGIGATMRFAGGTRVRIAGVLADELVGAAELMVSRATGSRIGISTEHYELIRPVAGTKLTAGGLAARLRNLLPGPGPGSGVRVRAPGDTPYFRAGDAALPPVLIKTLFGEFAARVDRGRPGYLELDPSWVRAHIRTVALPLLGRVTCNRAIIPQLRGAMETLVRRGLGSLIQSYDGCLAPRFINRIPTALISHHAWGIAIDINAATNLFGAPPHQDPRFVRVMRRWGFTWGGTFTVADGNHFEYRRAPERAI